MTLAEIKALVVSLDPQAQRYESAKVSEAYTVWHEYMQLGTMAGDRHTEGYAFQIDRFTKLEDDPMVATIKNGLENDDRVTYGYQVTYERDTGYIHHIFSCEAI